tara:strand:+ start:1016 stop:2284 length:1269 start_codon:yes stop_codon:yes gene_type:complete
MNIIKLILSVLTFLLVSNCTIAQTTVIPDVNFEQALINLGLDTGVPDGTVPTNNIDTLAILDITSSGLNLISDLTGIEDFTQLTKLYCSGNQLTNLDVSQNYALTFLDCGGNQLTNLDISQNSALTFLGCSSNQLTNLDVSQNNALISLFCSSNQLSNLDVSQNSALFNFGCSHNQLINLDVLQNNALFNLVCSYNQLTSLDIAQNTALYQLECSSNQLSNLDVTQNTALANLNCSLNQLTNLDVSQNNALDQFRCSSNQLTNLDVSQNNALTFLNCSNNQLTCLNVKNITPYIFITYLNPNLVCIEVDNIAYSTTNWTSIDPASSFNTSCPNPCAVGIEENNISILSLYPNPTNGIVTIDLGAVKQDIKTTLTNSLGQVILIEDYTSANFINLDIDAPKGIYFLQIETSEGESKILKVLKN